jgi:hypothetical protein
VRKEVSKGATTTSKACQTGPKVQVEETALTQNAISVLKEGV